MQMLSGNFAPRARAHERADGRWEIRACERGPARARVRACSRIRPFALHT